MNLNKIYLIANDDKKFASWMAEKRNKLNNYEVTGFNSQVGEMRYSSYFMKVSFILFWEIQTNDSFARVAFPFAVASHQHLLGRAVSQGNEELANIINALSVNFIRAYNELANANTNEDEDNEEE